LIKNVFGKSFKIEAVLRRDEKPVNVDFQRSKITIYEFSPILPRRIKERKLYTKLIIFYEVSTMGSPNKSSMDKIFYDFLRARSRM